MSRVLTIFCHLLFAILGVQALVDGAEPEAPVKITLHPAVETTPALKYRLLPGRMDQIPGNAAVYYGKVTAEEIPFFSNRELRENIVLWHEMPLEELRRKKIDIRSGNIEEAIRRGARSRFCDWQLPIGQVPFYTILLPEAQQSREFARILAARARIQMADGKYDDAVETLQTGYALGRHVASGETLVNGLIGIAICELMSRQVFVFAQQPDSPNLYWALTLLPEPMIDVRDALDVEAMGVELSFPELRNLENSERTPDQWKELFHRVAQQFLEQVAWSGSPQPPSLEALDERCQQLLPVARQALIAEGMLAADVDAMSEYQVAMLYSLLVYHELHQDGIKFFDLPYPQSIAGIEEAIKKAQSEKREIIPFAERLLPALQATRNATARSERRIAVLRLLEALRIYGANHEGQLPEKLTDVTEVPIPDDPVTEKPFEYRLEGNKAYLQGPLLRDEPLDYEISMVRP